MIDRLIGKESTVSDAKLLYLNAINLDNGTLTVVNSQLEVPFQIKRVYYLYDIPNKTDRGAHGHKELIQLVVAASGSFEISLYDGVNSKTFILRQPDEGLLIPPGLWRDLSNFSGGGVCVVLASDVYIESDYIREKDRFIQWKNK